MTIELNKDARAEAIKSIERYFEVHMQERIGNIQAGALLAFFLEEIGPSVYTPTTAAIYISWGPTPVFAEAAPMETAPAFVSPTEAPKPASDAAPAEGTPGANEIIAPAEAQPAQPSPPPGS